MKKFICLILTLGFMVTTPALSEIDLSGLSYEELVELHNRIQYKIFTETDHYQYASVPHGVYKIGTDIPEGNWIITCATKWDHVVVSWGEQLAPNGEEILKSGRFSVDNIVHNMGLQTFTMDLITSYNYHAVAGDYLVIREGIALFQTNPGIVGFTFIQK